MRKEHSAVDWSRRPLPEPWLTYAALDVELLVELRDVLADQLDAAGKREWAEQEFAMWAKVDSAPVRAEPWRRTSGIHRVRGRRGLALVRSMWELRDEIARGPRHHDQPDPARRGHHRGRPGRARARATHSAGCRASPPGRRPALRQGVRRGDQRRRSSCRHGAPDARPAARRPAAAAVVGRQEPGRRPSGWPVPRGRSSLWRASTTCRRRT